MKPLAFAIFAMATLWSQHASAAEASINFGAEVADQLSIITEDGKPLTETTLELIYKPQTRTLEPATLNFFVLSNKLNQKKKKITISNNGHAVPTLVSVHGHQVRLTVKLGDKDMINDRTQLKFNDAFPIFDLKENGAKSKMFTLRVAQENAEPVPAGNYKAKFTIYVRPDV